MVKRKTCCVVLLLLCAVLTLSACGSASDQAAPPASGEATATSDASEEADFGTTTLMIYMVGSDLEKHRAATTDMVEMSKSGVDLSRTNIVICAGGSTKWYNNLVDPGAITILRLTESGFQVEESFPLRSMGDPECLTSFVGLCAERFPADHYAMILWDHGNGPVVGYGNDMLFPGDNLTLQEMRQAMDQTPFAGDLRLDWVGFDACLMASAELACVWQNYADYLLSSEETEPGFGWNYAFLSQCGSCSPLELMCSAADAYFQYALDKYGAEEADHRELTLSVMDLSKVGQLEEAVNALFRSAASQVSGDYIRLARARVDTRSMGRSSTGKNSDLVDLKKIAENMSADFPEECAAVLSALDELVVYNRSNTPQCEGVSLYYPYYDAKRYMANWRDTYRDLAVFPDYLNYLERYETIWLGTDMQRYFSEPMTLEEGAAPSTYTLQLTEEQAEIFAKANYCILRRWGEAVYSMASSSSNVTLDGTKLTAHFDGRAFYFESDYQVSGIPYTHMWDTVDGVSDYSAMMAVVTRGEQYGSGEDAQSVEIRYSVKQDTGEMTLKGIFSHDDDAENYSGGKEELIDLSEWDAIRFYNNEQRFLIRDENGRIPYFWDWPLANDWNTWYNIPISDNPHFSYKPMYDDGSEYYIIINVMDVQGNLYSSELFPVQLAQAPEQEALPLHSVVWSEGDSVELLDMSNIRLTLQTELAVDNAGESYTLTAENRNDFPVIVSLGGTGTVLNGKVDCGENSLAWFSLEPGETQTAKLPVLANSVFRSQEERLRSLTCPCRITRHDNSATLLWGNLVLDVPSKPSFSVRWDPQLGALAEPQQILDVDGFQARVLHVGSPSDSGNYYRGNELVFQLGFENHSPSARDLSLHGFIINGWYMPVGGYSPRGTELHLESGQGFYPLLEFDANSIRSLFYDPAPLTEESDESLPSLNSISELAVCLSVDGQFFRCPVELTLHGDEPPVAPDGELLYEDDEMQIWLSGMSTSPGYEGDATPVWNLWALNRGDQVLHLYCVCSDPEAQATLFSSICPGGLIFFSISDFGQEDKDLSFILSSLEGYESGTVVLPAP